MRAEPGVLSADAATDPSAQADTVTATITTSSERDLREALAACVLRHGWGLRELRPRTLTLEEIFLALTADGGPAS